MVTEEEFIKLKEAFDALHFSYQRYHQFGRGLERSIHAFEIGFNCLSDQELNHINSIFERILDQWKPINDAEKEESIKKIRDLCKILEGSENKERIKTFFTSLQKIPPDPSDNYCRPRQHC